MIQVNNTTFTELSKYVATLISLVNDSGLLCNIIRVHGQYHHNYLTSHDGNKYSSTAILFEGTLTDDAKRKEYIYRPRTLSRGDNVVNVQLTADLHLIFQPYDIAAVALYRTGLHNYFKYPEESDVFRVEIRFVVDHKTFQEAASEVGRVITLNTLGSEDTKDISNIRFQIDDVKQFIESNKLIHSEYDN